MRTLSMSTPSSSMVFESDGIEPGVMPPMSAWWPRAATKNAGPPVAEEHRHDHRDVGQVRAAGVRRVQREGVARLHVAAAAPQDLLHATRPSSPGARACAARWR